MIFGYSGGISIQSWLSVLKDSVRQMREVEEPGFLDLLLLLLV